MLNIYISYAPADYRHVEKLLEWLRPMQEQYFLRIWFNHAPARPPELPFVWQLLLFWYRPSRQQYPFHPELPERVNQGHIYLFLTSHHALATPYIDQEEIPRAVQRYMAYGARFVRIFPVLVSPSIWKKQSRLAGFETLGPKRTLSEVKPEEEGYLEVMQQLRPVVEELRRNWIEETHLRGLPTDDFYRPEPPPLPPPQFTPLPGWAGWVIVVLMLYSLTNWYFSYCAPRMYFRYAPKDLPNEEIPDPYLRDNPVRPPTDVPLFPVDTLMPGGLPLPDADLTPNAPADSTRSGTGQDSLAPAVFDSSQAAPALPPPIPPTVPDTGGGGM